ncbi:peptidyl-alpha-hydroxyglycine alpha-amidating lyase family protein [Coraliomargarita sp. SDUM461004]|uniref:Peptidyl-alpha-hydroxyglycine alpha-amidating lyase family protein n=1 Tax=Thalassobacterium sedimentorum TaxID=3041258 RepID=A0ABU1AMV9_9BACT|nr:peptidyl-alpha-hydroxyglycine alpha-amidating lyase family protein [Coraliomargarita sp. SDUM461004]MDQ8196137.1 peptidyl-alpha-hydroxyglycine alpha-amidating lyase family protein [Coraliomargarita sp. SDUM461004]
MKKVITFTLLIGSLSSYINAANPNTDFSHWHPDPNWGAFANQDMIKVTGIDLDSKGNLYACGGDDEAVHVLDASGKEIARWGNFIVDKHGLRIFDDKVYITDIGSHVVYECSLEGKILRVFGTVGESGLDDEHFYKPTDICIAPNGNIYVSDGYGNSRIVCLNPAGEFLFAWGEPGNGPSQFCHPHNLVITDNKVIVADRDNKRMQIFEMDGTFIEEWNNVGQPYGLDMGSDGLLYVSTVMGPETHCVLVMTLAGQILESFGHKGAGDGGFDVPHSLTISKDVTSLTVGEVQNARVQRWNHKEHTHE